MLIALQKRQENIAEYLIYMWQVEDMLRACQLEEAKIEQLLVNRFATMTEDLAPIRQWYQELRDMILAEGKRESGHLQININVLNELYDFHQRMLKEGQDAIYSSCYYSTLPYIVELRSKEGDQLVGELETCFTALYGLLLLQLQKREVSEQTRAAMQQISKFIALLADRYKAWKKEDSLERS